MYLRFKYILHICMCVYVYMYIYIYTHTYLLFLSNGPAAAAAAPAPPPRPARSAAAVAPPRSVAITLSRPPSRPSLWCVLSSFLAWGHFVHYGVVRFGSAHAEPSSRATRSLRTKTASVNMRGLVIRLVLSLLWLSSLSLVLLLSLLVVVVVAVVVVVVVAVLLLLLLLRLLSLLSLLSLSLLIALIIVNYVLTAPSPRRRGPGRRLGCRQMGSTLLGPLQKQRILTDWGKRYALALLEYKSRFTGVPKRSPCQKTWNLPWPHPCRPHLPLSERRAAGGAPGTASGAPLRLFGRTKLCFSKNKHCFSKCLSKWSISSKPYSGTGASKTVLSATLFHGSAAAQASSRSFCLFVCLLMCCVVIIFIRLLIYC